MKTKDSLLLENAYELIQIKQFLLSEGYSQNSLDTLQRQENAVYQVKNGAYALHGIKTEEVLKKILEAANQTHFLNE